MHVVGAIITAVFILKWLDNLSKPEPGGYTPPRAKREPLGAYARRAVEVRRANAERERWKWHDRWLVPLVLAFYGGLGWYWWTH
jgi:hypothetical protein